MLSTAIKQSVLLLLEGWSREGTDTKTKINDKYILFNDVLHQIKLSEN